MNSDLIQLMNGKYKQKLSNLEQKAEILEKDVQFEKKENALMEKKIQFLEQNTQNIVESKVAERTDSLQLELENYRKKLQKYEREEEVRETKLRESIREEFIEDIR